MNRKVFLIVSLFLGLFSVAKSQVNTGNIKGTIITNEQKPAEGVSIIVKNTPRYAVSDNKGNFEIKNIAAGDYTLEISLVGHTNKEQDVTVEAGKTVEANFDLDISETELNEIVVVGNKTSFKTNRVSSSLRLQTSILELPQNIQVVTAKTINNQQIFDMLEGVTRNVSGAMRLDHWDNYARINMRGSTVSAFRNGMNVSTEWGPLTEDMSMVERIEFVKGPAGFMLSNGDPSGFYNVVTKKPSGQTKNEVSLSMGSFDLYRATGDFDGKLSKDGKLLYRLNVMGQLKGTNRPFDFNDRYAIVPVLKYVPDDKTAITLELTQQYVKSNIIGSNYSFSKKGYKDLPRDYTTAESNLPATYMNDRDVLAILEHKLNDNWKFTTQLAYFNYQQKGASLWPYGFDAGNDSLMQRGMSIWDVLGITKVGQAFINGKATTGSIVHKILAGVDMSNKEYYHDWSQGAALGGLFNIYDPVYGTVTIPQFERSINIKERGVRYYDGYSGYYAQDELGMFDNRLRLTLAGRYTTLKKGDVYNGDFKTSKFTPRVGLSFSINKNANIYFLRDESIMPNYGADWQKKSFDPITGTNIEAGVKIDWLNGKWNSTFAAYEITRNNVLTADLDHPNPTGGYYSRQSGQQKTKGIEADIRGQIVTGLDVLINYAFTDAKTTKDSDPQNIGVQVAGSSRHIQNSWLNYHVERGYLSGLGISLGYQYLAKRSPWYVFDGSSNSIDDYFRLDGGLSYQKGKIGFNCIVNNILNKYLYSGGPYADYYYWQSEPGTNVRFTVNYQF